MSAGLDFLPFSRLVGVTVPPRVRNLVEACWQLLWKSFEAGLDRTLREFDDSLFKHAEKARSNELQQLLMEAMRELKKRRADLMHDSRQRAQTTLLGLADRRLLHALEPAAPQGPLSLIDNTELEETLAASEVAARAELRNSQLLQPLAIRLAVIGGGEPFSSVLLPVGPTRIVDWLAHPLHAIELPAKIKVALLRQFEQSYLQPGYTELLNTLNQSLIDAKVLPNLQKMAMLRRSAMAVAEAATAESTPAAPPSPPKRSETATPRPTAEVATAAPAAESATGVADAELFSTLRELLAGRRAGGPGGPRGEPSGPVAARQDLQGVLSVLQSQPVAPIMVNGRWTTRKAQHIKQDILAQLRGLAAPGQSPPVLSDEDSDTIDLVGMLFDHLGEDLKPGSGSLLAKLQVPILKVALNDKSFFARRQHPARQLLNTLTEGAQLWLDDDDADPALFGKMQLVVDRVLTEFDQDLKVFENLLGELGSLLSGAQRKAEVAEKRHVEAARGREKLELAREHAAQAIRTRLEGIEVPTLLRQLLEGAWCDVLALGELRDGEGSQSYLDRLHVADVLVGIWNGASADDARRWYHELQGTLENGLQMVGFHSEEIDRTLDGLEALLPVSLAAPPGDAGMPTAPPAEAEQAERLLESKQRQLEAVTSSGLRPSPRETILSGLRKIEKIELNAKEQAMLERIRQIPFGTWFDFVINQQGDTTRRKLSWYSPVTGRCLFVSARGARGEERTMEQLARDLVRGNVRLHEERHEGLVDRTWKKIVGKLRDWTQGERTLSETLASQPAEPWGRS